MADQEITRLQGVCTDLADQLAAETSAHAATQRRLQQEQQLLRRLATELAVAEERERRQIASDLHDHLGQALALIKVRLLSFQGDAIFSGSERTIAGIVKLLDQSIRYTRTLTSEISPPVLYELGLGPALRWLAEDFQQKHGLAVAVTVPDRIEVPEDLRIVLFKSVRELLFNVVRHAGVSAATLAAHATPGRLEIVVTDRGCGTDAAEACETHHHSGGFGLFSIRERLSASGGSFEFVSRPGEGATVTISVPIIAEETA